jgi:hypothetical protein
VVLKTENAEEVCVMLAVTEALNDIEHISKTIGDI